MIQNFLTAVVFFTFAVCCAVSALHNYHMFQLGSYKARGYLAALKFKWYGLPRLTKNAQRIKKPLVYTPRVMRMFFTHAVLLALPAAWSLSMGWFGRICFLALLVILSPLFVVLSNLLNSPVEKAINNRYISDARRILSDMPRLIVIGVTGSYGKTSTKYFLTKLLSSKYNTLMTPESYNTPMGVVKTIRTRLRPVHDVFVCEMGARHTGDIKEICDIVKPRHGIITAIGEQHLETFGTVENIVQTKFELADAIPPAGVLFLNGDSEAVNKHSQNYGGHKIYYSISGQNQCDYAAGEISVSGAGSSFRLTFPDGESRTFETPLIGKHNVQNIVGAIAAADYLGVDRDDMAVSVGRLEAVPHRLQLIKRNSIIIIDDAYNSNPSGAKAALETLAMFDGLKILITPGMVELGGAQDERNRRFGAEAAQVCDCVFLVGERQTKSILEGWKSASLPAFPLRPAKVVDTLEAALGEVEKIDSRGRQKIVLLENDLPDNY